MNIVIAGGTGFIGRPLAESLATEGHQVTVLSRHPGDLRGNPKWRLWDGATQGAWREAIESAEAVVNLAGENIAESRWSEARKASLRESRLSSTLAIVSSIASAQSPPKVLINASAIGYYGDCGNQVLDEASGPGTGFLPELCADWEKEASKAIPLGVRTIYLRIGIVLAAGGGALAKMLPAFKMCAGGPLGGGKQWMSWISRRDLISIIRFLLTSDIEGPVNATSPNPVSNHDFSKTLAASLRKPCWLPVPEFVLGMVLGEMSDLLVNSQRVLPHKLMGGDYKFRDPDLRPTIDACLREVK